MKRVRAVKTQRVKLWPNTDGMPTGLKPRFQKKWRRRKMKEAGRYYKRLKDYWDYWDLGLLFRISKFDDAPVPLL